MTKPTLTTERLIIRPIKAEDLDCFIGLNTDARVMRYINGGIPETETKIKGDFEKVLAREQKRTDGQGLWMGILKETNEPIGWYILKQLPDGEDREVGYRLLHKYWGKGYATEGAKCLVEYGFETLNLPRIIGVTDPENIASQNVLQKCGLIYTGMGKYMHYDVKLFLVEGRG